MLVRAMTGKEIFKEHFFRIRYDFLDNTQQIKEESSVGYSCVKNGLLYSSLEEAENKAEQKLRVQLVKNNLYQVAYTLFQEICSISEVTVKIFEPVASLQYIEINGLNDWRFTGYIRVALSVKKTGEIYWDFFDVNEKSWEINVLAWAHEIIRYSSLPIFETANLNDMVLDSGKPGVIFHEIGHLLECDNIKKDALHSFPSNFSVVDNPLLRQYNGSYSVDDNGNIAKKTAVIDSGKIVSSIGTYDSYDCSITTCGRRMNYSSLPLPRMSVTFLDSGDYSPADIISGVDNGVFVKSIVNSYAIPKTGIINFCNGVTYPINGGIVDTNYRCVERNNRVPLYGLLGGIKEVGNDLRIVMGRGLCNKKGQEIVCSYGTPTTHIMLE